MLKELVTYSPLLLVSAGILFLLSRNSGPEHQHEITEDEAIQRIDDMVDDEVAEGEFEDDEAGEFADEYLPTADEVYANLTPEMRQALRDQVNPTPAQIAARQAEATGVAPSPSRGNRTVGAKKAKSLAQRDQIRAYNEYQGMLAQQRRMEEEAYQEKYGDLIEEERQSRIQREESAESKIKQRRAKQKEQEAEARQRLADVRRTLESQLNIEGRVKLSNELERGIANDIKSSAPGTFVVSGGEWLVRPDSAMYDRLAAKVKAAGRISFAELAVEM